MVGVFFATPLKNDGVKVSWDDEFPNWMESHKSHVPNHQSDKLVLKIIETYCNPCFGNVLEIHFEDCEIPIYSPVN